MGRKASWLSLIVMIIFTLIGCESDKEEVVSKTNQVNEKQIVESKDKQDKKAPTNIQLSGEVISENGKIIVKGKSNLIEGTNVEIDWLDRPFSIRNPVCLLCDKITIVDKNGNFTYEIPTDLKNFGFIYVTMEVVLGGLGQSDEIEAVYGEQGENLKGPFVAKHEILGEEYQKIFASILVFPSGEKTVYQIETPKRGKVPADVGSSKVWVKTELTNDHQYFYIKGKSNLIEGTEFVASYYSSEEAAVAQNWVSSSANVVSDGTFTLQIPYDSITENGFIVMTSKGNNRHLLGAKMESIYGEQFKEMTGEQVVPNEEGGNMVKVVLHPKQPIVKAPEETRVTTDGEETKVQLPDEILFDHDQSELKPDAQNTLNELLQPLEALNLGTVLQINGHTDSTGDDQYNLMLSEKRAKSVEAYMRQSGKVSHLTISTAGLGETSPIAVDDSEEGKAKNRRVEIVINPK